MGFFAMDPGFGGWEPQKEDDQHPPVKRIEGDIVIPFLLLQQLQALRARLPGVPQGEASAADVSVPSVNIDLWKYQRGVTLAHAIDQGRFRMQLDVCDAVCEHVARSHIIRLFQPYEEEEQ